MAELPHGTVTFLFTDIEGATRRWERDRSAMAAAVARHLALLDQAIVSHNGAHFKTVGDAVQAAFSTAPDAVAAALAPQHAVLSEDWGTPEPLRVRMALHAGEAIPDDRGDYLAAPLNRLARLLAIGHRGQILVSQAVQQLVRASLPADAAIKDLGKHRFWKRCGSSGLSTWRRAARRTLYLPSALPSSRPGLRRLSPSCAAHGRSSGWVRWTSSRATCGRRWGGRCGTLRRRRSGWPPRSIGAGSCAATSGKGAPGWSGPWPPRRAQTSGGSWPSTGQVFWPGTRATLASPEPGRRSPGVGEQVWGRAGPGLGIAQPRCGDSPGRGPRASEGALRAGARCLPRTGGTVGRRPRRLRHWYGGSGGRQDQRRSTVVRAGAGRS